MRHLTRNRTPNLDSANCKVGPVLGILSFAFACHIVRAADFSALAPLLQQHCVECHGNQEPDGGLVLESFEGLRKGGESGPAFIAGKAAESRIIKALEGTWGKTGKNQFMPPGKRDHLKPEEIALFRAWIDAGAPAPLADVGVSRAELVVPKITPKSSPRRSINDLAFDAKSGSLAVARPDGVELINPDTRALIRTLLGMPGPVNAVAFSRDGQFVFAAGGWPTQSGEIRQWRTETGELMRTFGGPRDSLHSLVVSPDGTIVAAGSYDYSVTLWRVGEGTVFKTVNVNQGAVMGLAFRPDGQVLATASYDRTAKLIDANTGIRLETFGQALKELNAVAFSPDGKTLLSGGNDNRIRAYHISSDGKEGSNELLATVFAHEGALLRLAYSPDGKTLASSADDRTVKLFTIPDLKQRATIELQPDWPAALTFAGNDRLVVGRADGSLGVYNTSDGKTWTPPPPPKPVVSQIQPRGITRGTESQIQLTGKHLVDAKVVSIYTDHLIAVLAPEVTNGVVTFPLAVPAAQPRGSLELTVSTPAGESGRIKLWVDDLVQSTNSQIAPPVAVWGVLARPGQTAAYEFEATAGTTLLFDLQGQTLGSKGDFTLGLFDGTGRPLAANDTYADQSDPLIVYRFDTTGRYKVVVGEATYGGSPEHAFRLSVGALPFITDIFPHAVSTSTTNDVWAAGINIPGSAPIRVVAGADSSVALPVPDGWRTRREWRLDVSSSSTTSEMEPNNASTNANALMAPVVVNAHLDPPSDVDYFRFSAEAGRRYVIETAAARRGSPADTRLEVFWPDGRPVERVRLQALRNSAVTFRAEDSNDAGIRFDNWEEMELNDYLYCGGDVMKIFRAPQGPDSDTALYSSSGRRRAWFDTTAVAHYLDEPVYVVMPLEAGAKPVANGLPAFTVYYRNDDAGKRDISRDSRIYFTAPASGDFLVRVDDSRGVSAPASTYALTIRSAEPDFTVRLNGAPGNVAKGSGQAFTLGIERRDDFEGAVDGEFLHLPKGWTVGSPVRIEAGQDTAVLTLCAASDAMQPDDAAWDAVRVVAWGSVDGRAIVQSVNNLGRPKLVSEVPKILVSLETIGDTNERTVFIQPGKTARAKLKIERHGHEGVVVFNVDNLPHGVIVENLGLNGITFLADENEREISFAAARWVGDLDRPFHAVENQAGRQTSRPLILKVRRTAVQAAK